MNAGEQLGPIAGLEIREKIGQGGMGAVYKAYQPALDRLVALKTVQAVSDDALGMFRREARLLAKCNHPQIVKILEFHPEHAIPYFLMEYVDGLPLDQAVRERTWKERAALFKDVVATVASAHEYGVVHGDLKPTNILVDRRFKPHVLDFGLARVSGADPVDAEGASSYGGTPGYLAPEVWDGQAPAVASDVYALGITLYVLLTGVLPFRDLEQARAGYCKLPLEQNPDIPEPLQRICLKAMERQPEDRYLTAEHMQRDLERFCDGKPIFSRPPRYLRELAGRVSNHVTEIQMWEQEGFISRRERDLLSDPYQAVLGADSPWLSETRSILTGALLIRLGAWFLLISALLWPVFYWRELGKLARVASAGVPTLLMAGIGISYLLGGRRRYALACLGSFVLLLLVFEGVLLSEYRWLRYPQGVEWELLGDAVDRHDHEDDRPGKIEDIARKVDGDMLQDAQAPMAQAPLPHRPGLLGKHGPKGLDPKQAARRAEQLHNVVGNLTEFILSNSQLFATSLSAVLAIALLLWRLRAPFFALWLSVACMFTFTAGLLLIGDKERLLHNRVAWVTIHFLVLAAVVYLLGYILERLTAARLGKPFYWTALAVSLVAAISLSVYGTKEWFNEPWTAGNEIWNFWLLAYSVPIFFWAWGIEKLGSEGQRILPRWLYLLVPLFLLVPINLLFHQGPELFSLALGPVRIYQLIYLPACVLLLALGRLLHMESFVLAGLWGLAVWIFRITFNHFNPYVSWPLSIALLGGGLLALGIWRSRRWELLPDEGIRAARPTKGAGLTAGDQETIALPR